MDKDIDVTDRKPYKFVFFAFLKYSSICIYVQHFAGVVVMFLVLLGRSKISNCSVNLYMLSVNLLGSLKSFEKCDRIIKLSQNLMNIF